MATTKDDDTIKRHAAVMPTAVAVEDDANAIPFDRALLEEIVDEATEPVRHCAECGTEFPTKLAQRARFCSNPCKNAYTNREKLRGAALFRTAYHWRRLSRSKDPEDRKDGGRYLKLLCQQLDRYAREDKESGRKPPARPMPDAVGED